MEFEDYNNTSKAYDATRVPAGLAELKKLVKPGSKLLDCGCGTGNYLCPMASHVGEAVGLEFNAGMREQVTKKVERLGLKNVQIIEGSLLERLPFDDATFDAVEITQVIHHIDSGAPFPNLGAALKEIHRVLRPGGVVCINHTTATQMQGPYWYLLLTPKALKQSLPRFIEAEDFERLATDAGLTKVAHIPVPEPLQGVSYFDLSGPFKTAYRQGDSTWAFADDSEVAEAQESVERMAAEGTLAAFFAKSEDERMQKGQATWFAYTKQ